MVSETYYPSNTAPDPMDVVWCHFPYDEHPGVPAVDPHPALVFEAVEFRPDQWAVLVVFGTSNLRRGDHSFNFVVQNVSEMNFAGLYYPTLFDIGRSKRLVWTNRWFLSPDPYKYSTPKVGRISERGQEIVRIILRRRAASGLPNPV